MPSKMISTRACGEIQTDKPKWTLYKVPPEIRRKIFVESAHNFLDIKRDLRPGLGQDMHELYCPDLLFEWDPLLYPDENQTSKPPKGLSNLELALYGRENELYFEAFHARLSLSKLCFAPPKLSAKRNQNVAYASFGIELPYWVLDSVRHVRFEVDHSRATCKGVRLNELDVGTSYTTTEARFTYNSQRREMEWVPSEWDWCNSQWRHFRESAMNLARALQVKVKECPNSRPLDRRIMIEVSGLCHKCSARIEDCDVLFEELLGFEGHFITPLSSLVAAPSDPLSDDATLITRQYLHPLNLSYGTT